MRNQNIAGIWEFVQTFEGESTKRFTAELKVSGEVIVEEQGFNLIGVYQLNEAGDLMSLSLVNFQPGGQKILTYLGELSYEGVFGRVKELDVNNEIVHRGTWGATILSRHFQ